ncbi:hypothetical protein AL036_12860 [Salipiger aestuarii]|uniref:GspL/Epsl periplasmic domain-containing protein n=1 Tax=Salipiger aestuarii TaxID=568098 RepID=UPI00025B6A55|nr:GspL/Epsl periplasmic domain-containing protein [Salipiger aestuarii]EIE50735.1 hypothetical protein C357_12404 [Citreicella sp. 357]KAA8606835.1 hypothetical protein AL036_12860 [Salipiger aestuarii]
MTAGSGHDREEPQVTLVSGAEVALLTLDLPARLRGQAREQVALRMLSDRLGLGPGEFAMRPFANGSAPWTRVFVVARPLIDAWRDGPTPVLPDYLALPAASGIWCVTETDDGMLCARLGPDDGFAAVPSVAMLQLTRALARDGAPGALLLPHRLPALADWADRQGIPVATTPDAVAALGLPRPHDFAHGELACDLRRDPLAARSRLERQVLPWRWPVLAAALAMALWAGAQYLAIDRLDRARAGIDSTTRALVREQVVPSGPILDMRVQVARALADARAAQAMQRGAEDPVALTARAAGIVAVSDARPRDIAWASGEGLTLVLLLPDFAATDRIAAQLGDAGFAVAITESLAREGGGVRSTVLLQPEAPR